MHHFMSSNTKKPESESYESYSVKITEWDKLLYLQTKQCRFIEENPEEAQWVQ